MSEKTKETPEEMEEDPPPPIKPYCPVTVEPVVALVSMATIMTSTLRQQYIFYRIANGTVNQQGGSCFDDIDMGNSSNASAAASTVQEGQIAQAAAIQWVARLKLADSIPALVVTLMIGSLSDKLGRKLNLIIPMSGLLVEALLGALLVQFNLPLAVLIPAAIASGLTGGSQTMIGGGFAYIADITGEGRARYFRHAIIQSTFGLAVIIGALGGSYWFQQIGFPLGVLQPFWFSAAGIVLSLIYTIFALKETCPAKPGTRLCTLSNITGIVQLFRVKRKIPTWTIAVLTLVFFLLFSVLNSSILIVFTFVIGPPFCWSPSYIGYVHCTFGSTVVVSMIAIKIFSKYPYGMITAGYVSGLCAFILLGLSIYAPNRTVAVFMAPVVGCLATGAVTVLRTIMSNMVRQDEQGSLFGLLTFAINLGNVALLPLWAFVYAKTIPIMPSMVFFIFAGVLLICAALTGCVKFSLPEMDDENVEKDAAVEDCVVRDGEVNEGMLNGEQCETKL